MDPDDEYDSGQEDIAQTAAIGNGGALPAGLQSLLEAQIGEAFAILQNHSARIRGGSYVPTLLAVSDAMSRLLSASASVAAVAARLQSGGQESRHRVIVERAQPAPRGEGVAKTAKRINPPDV
jgi:hypothetical protein